jgi:hypothetical protein
MIEYFCGQKLTEIFYRNFFLKYLLGPTKTYLKYLTLFENVL